VWEYFLRCVDLFVSFQDSTEKASKATEELDAGIAKDQNLARNIDTAKAKAGEVGFAPTPHHSTLVYSLTIVPRVNVK